MNLTLQQAKDRFAQFGTCNHDEKFHIITEPYKCGIKLTECGICGKRIKLVYLS